MVFEMDTITFTSTWYNYPVHDQKFIALIIQRSHKRFEFTGYGMINCTLATFLSVSDTIWYNQFNR